MRRLRQAALLTHPGALPLRELALEHDPPFVALAWVEPADPPFPAVPLPLAQAKAGPAPRSAVLPSPRGDERRTLAACRKRPGKARS